MTSENPVRPVTVGHGDRREYVRRRRRAAAREAAVHAALVARARQVVADDARIGQHALAAALGVTDWRAGVIMREIGHRGRSGPRPREDED